MKKTLFSLSGLIILLSSISVQAITFIPSFGPHGEGGQRHGQNFQIGTDGKVFELDAYLNIAGEDLNGSAFGTSAQFSLDPLPAGLDFSFNPRLSADSKDLTLRYTFVNKTGADIENITFLSFLDVDIGISGLSDYATTNGNLAPGENFEVDSPTSIPPTFPPIFDNLLSGTLTGTNAFPSSSQTGDVSMALSFLQAELPENKSLIIDIMISEATGSIGGFSLTQHDTVSPTTVTYSGAVVTTSVPEASSFLLAGIGLLTLMGYRRRM